MFQIENSLVSEEIIYNDFVCNLNACKGACCVEGDGGAPLEKDETELLEKHYGKISLFMSKKGKAAIEKQGKFIQVDKETFETPLVNNKECAYAVFGSNGTTQCAIENAHRAKSIDWKKPISCHLYPVRVKEYSDFYAVNYHRWHICEAGCQLGESLKIPVYQFVKDALIRKFGKRWYSELEMAAQKINS
ncbi:MAG: DUF3109 family protein [Flavobacteriaceae bacterium]